MESKMGNFRFTGQRYVSEYVIPNFHFHLTSAYCIMRTQGVPLGAFDYLKDVFEKVQELVCEKRGYSSKEGRELPDEEISLKNSARQTIQK